jgi:hypothetical protein
LAWQQSMKQFILSPSYEQFPVLYQKRNNRIVE